MTTALLGRGRLNNVGTPTRKSTGEAKTNGLTFATSSTETCTWTSTPGIGLSISNTTNTAPTNYVALSVGSEIVWLVTYSGSGSTGKCLRGREGTIAATHTKAPWWNGQTVWDSLIAGEYTLPAAAYFQTAPPILGYFQEGQPLTSSKVYLWALTLPVGVPIGHIAVLSSTGATSPTHWYFLLCNQTYGLLATTADQTTTAWAGQTLKSLPIAKTAAGTATVFETTYFGTHYVGISMVASTRVEPIACSSTPVQYITSPHLSFSAIGTHTTPPTFPTTFALTLASAFVGYAYVGP